MMLRSALAGGLLLASCSSYPNDWPKSTAETRDRLISVGFLKPSDGDWSPESAGPAGSYRAIWFDATDRENDVRAWLGSDGVIKRITITTDDRDEPSDTRAATALLAAVAPKSPFSDRQAAAIAFARAIQANVKSKMKVGDIELKSSGGWIHHTLQASPS